MAFGLWLLPGLALAQAPGEGAPAAAGAAAPVPVADEPEAPPARVVPGWPAAPELGPVRVAEAYVWRRVGPPSDQPVDSVDVDPGNLLSWIALTHDGAAWLTADAGESWVRVLPPARRDVEEAPDPEHVLMEVENQLGETVEVSTDLEDLLDLTQRALGDEAAAAVAPNLSPTWLGRVFFDPTRIGLVWAGRWDGLWRSSDGGTSWDRMTEFAPSEITRWGDVLVIGGLGGIAASVDEGERWIEVAGPLGDAEVLDVQAVGDTLYAGTSAGLFRSADGIRWARVTAAGEAPVSSVVPDPDWPQGFWLAGDGGLRRTDDGGRSFYVAGTQPLAGLRQMVALPGKGHLLVVSGDGVWESTDGGVRWALASRLLTDPDVRAVDVKGPTPVIAARGGVWVMRPFEAPKAEARTLVAGMGLGEAVELATRRRGIDRAPLLLSRAATVAKILPQPELYFTWDSDAGRATNWPLRSTTQDEGSAWQAGLRFRFGLGSDSSSTGDVDELDTEYLFEADNAYVLGDQVYLEGTYTAAAANTMQRMHQYQVTLADQVSEAWMTRHRLVAEEALVSNQPLLEQVEYHLKILELDARLDMWTDGAWRESLHPVTEPR